MSIRSEIRAALVDGTKSTDELLPRVPSAEPVKEVDPVVETIRAVSPEDRFIPLNKMPLPAKRVRRPKTKTTGAA